VSPKASSLKKLQTKIQEGYLVNEIRPQVAQSETLYTYSWVNLMKRVRYILNKGTQGEFIGVESALSATEPPIPMAR
jgi:hypothetical protein